MQRQGFLGIDVSKDTFTVAFLIVAPLSGEILHEHIETLPYDRTGWHRFLTAWAAFHADHWWVGLEASGPYSALLEAHLTRLDRPDVSLHRLSPSQVRDFAKSRSRRRTKTDRLDARTIALFLRQQLTVQALPAPLQDHTPLRTLAHLDQHLAQELTRTQNQVRQLLHFLFPELERAYARFPKALRTLLRHFPSAQAIAQAAPEALAQVLPPRHRLDLAALQALAQTSFGLHDPTRTQALQLLLDRWTLLDHLRAQCFALLRQAVRRRYPQAWDILTAIPGIGPRLAALFLALVGDLHRFPNPKALVAYAGLDVTLYQSGRFQGRRRLSKRGDPLLRHVLYLMAVTLTRHTRRFAHAFTHHRQKGRAVRETFVILSRKALVMCYHLLRRVIHFQDIPEPVPAQSL